MSSLTPRTGHIGAFVFEQGRRGSLRRVLLILVIVTSLLLYVGGKVRIMRLGYQIEALEREKQELERANRSLRIEASSLAAPARIEEIATKKLGMVMPAKGDIVVVKRKEARKH
ncbi:MAG TPA: cell division protein FtsL [Nitrospirota bacterium]|nr:cell division protein FtsL [Nitrospirota bacterium]